MSFIVVVKKTFRYTNVFSYNHLYQPEFFMKSGINCLVCGGDLKFARPPKAGKPRALSWGPSMEMSGAEENKVKMQWPPFDGSRGHFDSGDTG